MALPKPLVSTRRPFPLETLSQVLNAANIDLKGFNEAFYRDHCQGEPPPVLATLVWMVRLSSFPSPPTLPPGECCSSKHAPFARHREVVVSQCWSVLPMMGCRN